MSIIIQTITVSWNKDFRGGKAAAERNSLPEAFELPLKACVNHNNDIIIVHEVGCHSYNNFKMKENVSFLEDSEIKIKGALIKIKSDILQVNFIYSDYDCGKPYRSKCDELGSVIPLNEKAFDLQFYQYGRIVFNGRYTDLDTGNWWYEKKVHNIIQTEKIKKDIFLDSVNITKYEQLAILK